MRDQDGKNRRGEVRTGRIRQEREGRTGEIITEERGTGEDSSRTGEIITEERGIEADNSRKGQFRRGQDCTNTRGERGQVSCLGSGSFRQAR
jgi:hypothetical protein